MKKQLLLILLGLSLAVYACEEKTKTPEPDPKLEIEEAWNTFAAHWENEAVADLVTIYTEDAVNIPPESEIHKGRDAIAKFYEFLFSNHLSSTYQHKIKSLQAHENSAIEYGEFTVNWVRNDSTLWTFKGRSMTHWVKAESGKWHITKFLFNRPPAVEENEAP